MIPEKKFIILTSKLFLILMCFSRIQVLIWVLIKLALYVCGCFILQNVQAYTVCVYLSSFFDNLFFDA